jgi:hypothetical protein
MTTDDNSTLQMPQNMGLPHPPNKKPHHIVYIWKVLNAGSTLIIQYPYNHKRKSVEVHNKSVKDQNFGISFQSKHCKCDTTFGASLTENEKYHVLL